MQRLKRTLSPQSPTQPRGTHVLVASESPWSRSPSSSLPSVPADISATSQFAMEEQRRGGSPRTIAYECPGCEGCRRWKCLSNNELKMVGRMTKTPIPLECPEHRIREMVEEQADYMIASGNSYEDNKKKKRGTNIQSKSWLGRRVACEIEKGWKSEDVEENRGMVRAESEESLVLVNFGQSPIVPSTRAQSPTMSVRSSKTRNTRNAVSEIARDLAEQTEDLAPAINDEDISLLELPQRAVEKLEFDPKSVGRVSISPTHEELPPVRYAESPRFYIDHRNHRYSVESRDSAPPLSLLIEVDDRSTPSLRRSRDSAPPLSLLIEVDDRSTPSLRRIGPGSSSSRRSIPGRCSVPESESEEPGSTFPTFHIPDSTPESSSRRTSRGRWVVNRRNADLEFRSHDPDGPLYSASVGQIAPLPNSTSESSSRKISRGRQTANPHSSNSDSHSESGGPTSPTTGDTSPPFCSFELPPPKSSLQQWRPHPQPAVPTTLLSSKRFYTAAERETNPSPPTPTDSTTSTISHLFIDSDYMSHPMQPSTGTASSVISHLSFDSDYMSHPQPSDRADAHPLYHQPYPDLESSATLSEFGFEPTLNLMSKSPRIPRRRQKRSEPEEEEIQIVEERVPVLLGAGERVGKECNCIPGETAWCNNSVPIFSEPVKAWVPMRKVRMCDGGEERVWFPPARKWKIPGLG